MNTTPLALPFEQSPAASPPLISVILPTFQSAGWVQGALDSLARQTERDFEVVVSDGGSSDNTLAVIEACRSQLPALQVLSRKDRGVYDAINLAMEACRGRWVYVLGSDDRLHANDTLAQVAATLRNTAATVVYGDVRVLGVNAMVADGARYGGPFTLARLMGQNICHQALFMRRECHVRVGPYDLRFRLWADWVLIQRLFVNEPTLWVDIVVADYAATGMSTGASDSVFLATRRQRLWSLWWARPWSLSVPNAVLRQLYWDMRKRRDVGLARQSPGN